MKRMLLRSCLGVSILVSASAVHASEWRAAGFSPAAASAPVAPVAQPAFQLGRPVTGGGPKNSIAPPVVQTTAFSSPRLASPVKTRPTIRAQGPEAVLAAPNGVYSPEEQYNCGVVTDGPATGGHPWFSHHKDKRHGLGGLFGHHSAHDDFGGRAQWQSDHDYDKFISPVTNPFFFEDPRSLTEVRPIFIYQSAPGSNRQFGGGEVTFYGLQARLALTERWSLVLHKLGGVNLDSDGVGPTAVRDGNGLSEIAFGPKFTFLRGDDWVGALGVNFEFSGGAESAYQDTGRGGVTPYITMGKEVGCWHFLGSFGYRFGYGNERSDSFFTSFHVDYGFFNRIYPLVELNWYHYTDSGRTFAAEFEGQDLVNFGSNSVGGNDVVTMATGLRVKITDCIHFGFAYEFPLTGREDLLDYRITADLIFRY